MILGSTIHRSGGRSIWSIGLLAIACGGAAANAAGDTTGVVPRGTRHFGIHVSQAQTGGYDQAFALARQAGMDVVTWAISWTQLQSDHAFDPTLLGVANTYYGSRAIPIHLTILSPINTNVTDVPAAVRGLPLNDPRVIGAYDVLLDSMHARLPQVQIQTLILGNEIDATLGSDDARWRQYQEFFDSTRAHAHALWGSALRVSATLTFNGLQQDPPPLDRFIATLDFLSVTYYPLASNFTVRPLGDVPSDVGLVIARARGKPVQFAEVGLPSSATNGSSEDNQAAFVSAIFRAWDAHASQIRFVAHLWLTDLSDSSAQAFVGYYGLTGQPDAERFKEYLRTLGLRRYDGAGSDKPAFTRLKQELAARGW